MKANAGCVSVIWIFKAAFVLEGASEAVIIYISGKSGLSALTPLSLSLSSRYTGHTLFFCINFKWCINTGK